MTDNLLITSELYKNMVLISELEKESITYNGILELIPDTSNKQFILLLTVH